MTETLRIKHYVISQGDIDRAELCPASRVYVGPKMPPHPGMWYGIFLHRFLQYAKERGRDAALRYVRSKRNKGLVNVCEKINVDEIPDGMSEEGFTLNTSDRTADIAPHDSAIVEEHIYARSDILFYDDKRDGRPHVADFKSGDRSYDPATSTQLLTLACAVSSACNSDIVPVSVVNVLKTGELKWNTHEHKAKALDKHWTRMRRVHLEVLETRYELRDEGLEPAFVPGEHCKGCRAEVACLHKRIEKRGKR